MAKAKTLGHCHWCGERLPLADLKWMGTKGRYGVYQCKSTSVCRWRRRRNFDKLQTTFVFEDVS